MTTREKIIITSFITIVAGFTLYFGSRECKNGHNEKQIQMPVSVVVGGSKYGGSIGIPVGNAKEVEVFVCDQYK